jgi:hypothetical protein
MMKSVAQEGKKGFFDEVDMYSKNPKAEGPVAERSQALAAYGFTDH